MSDQAQEKHQLAGLDTRERGFSRLVVFEQADGGYQAILRYETTRVVTTAYDTPGAALEELVRTLQGQGYSQLRSQLSVREQLPDRTRHGHCCRRTEDGSNRIAPHELY